MTHEMLDLRSRVEKLPTLISFGSMIGRSAGQLMPLEVGELTGAIDGAKSALAAAVEPQTGSRLMYPGGDSGTTHPQPEKGHMLPQLPQASEDG